MNLHQLAVKRSVAAIATMAAITCGLTTAATAATAAQSQPGAAAKPMAAAAMMKPNAALAQLNYFAGTWKCAGTSWDDAKAHPVEATVKLAWELDGYFLGVDYQEQKTKANPMPVGDKEHWGYSDETRMLVAGSVDSMGGYGTKATSGWEGDSLVWKGDTHMMGSKMGLRETFVKKGDNEVMDTGELEMNGAWTKQFEMTCHRTGR